MNAAFSSSGWLFISLLALEIVALVGIAALIHGRLKSALWQCTVWQACVVGVLLLTVIELSGAGRMIAGLATRKGHSLPGLSPSVGDSAHPEVAASQVQLKEGFRDQVAQRIEANQRNQLSQKSSIALLATQVPAIPNPDLSTASPIQSENPETEAPPAMSPLLWFVLAWVIGLGVGVSRILFGCFATLVLRGKYTTACQDDWEARLKGIADQLGFKQPVRLVHSRRLTAPIAFGLLRPTIALPPGFAEHFSEAQQDAMLAHELAHLSARDPLWRFLTDFTVAVLWWHPLVWWMRCRVLATSEIAADEASLLIHRGPDALAECLIEIGKQLTRHPFRAVASVSGFRSGLGRRVERLLHLRGSAWTPPHRVGSILARTLCPTALIPVFLFGTAWLVPPTVNRGGTMNLIKNTWAQSLAVIMFVSSGEHNPATAANVAEARSNTSSNAGERTTSNNAQEKVPVLGDLPLLGRLFSNDSSMVRRNASEMAVSNESFPGTERATDRPAADEQPNRATRDELNASLEKLHKLLAQYSNAHPQVVALREKIKVLEDQLAENAGLERISKDRLNRLRRQRFDELLGQTDSARATTSEQAKVVEAKLDNITFKEAFFDGLPLSEVLRFLNEQTQNLDPDKLGLNFLINPNTPASSEPAVAAIDPSTGLAIPGAPQETIDVNGILIKFNLPLRNVRLKDLLNAIVKVAEYPIQYSVEDYGVVFSADTAANAQPTLAWTGQPQPLEVRTFKVDTNTFLAGLESTFGVKANKQQGNSSQDVRNLLRDVFTQLGIDMSIPGKAVFYNALPGVVMVRATGPDLEIVQAAIETLNGYVAGNPPRLPVGALSPR